MKNKTDINKLIARKNKLGRLIWSLTQKENKLAAKIRTMKRGIMKKTTRLEFADRLHNKAINYHGILPTWMNYRYNEAWVMYSAIEKQAELAAFKKIFRLFVY